MNEYPEYIRYLEIVVVTVIIIMVAFEIYLTAKESDQNDGY